MVVVPSRSAPELNLDFRQEVMRCVADRTLCTEFLRIVAERPDEVCLRRPDGANWRCYSWSGYVERLGLVAVGLRRLGLGKPVPKIVQFGSVPPCQIGHEGLT